MDLEQTIVTLGEWEGVPPLVFFLHIASLSPLKQKVVGLGGRGKDGMWKKTPGAHTLPCSLCYCVRE